MAFSLNNLNSYSTQTNLRSLLFSKTICKVRPDMGDTFDSDTDYHYKAYGLKITSCIPCPELLAGNGSPDVTIRYGKTPRSLAGAQAKAGYYQATPEQLLLTIDGAARFLVSRGEEILIDRASDSNDVEVRLYLLGSALGALLHQRGLLPLHASAFEANGGCVAILGHTGLGKSTLAGVFRKRGYRIIADDVCVVSVNGIEVPLVLPGYPQLKLSTDAARKLGERPESMLKILSKPEKYGLGLEGSFYQEPLSLHRLYVLSTPHAHVFNLRQLKGMEKLTAIINNTYRVQFIEGLGRKESHFEQCVAVAKHVAVKRVTRPDEPFLLDELADLLEKDFSYKNFTQDWQD
jgi:hypothetical protein